MFVSVFVSSLVLLVCDVLDVSEGKLVGWDFELCMYLLLLELLCVEVM